MNRKILVIFFLISCSFTLNAQLFRSETKLDSIISANEKYQLRDTVKLNLLLQLAFNYKKKDPAKGISTADEALQLAMDLHKAEYQAEGYVLKAVNQIANSQEDKGFESLDSALEILQKTMDKKNLANCYFVSGLARNKQNKYNAALADLSKALSYLDDKKEKEAGVIYRETGNVYFNMSDFPNALTYFFKALDILARSNNPDLLIGIYSDLGRTYGTLSETGKALEYFNKGLNLAEQFQFMSSVESACANIGGAYYSMGNDSLASIYLERSIFLCDSLKKKNKGSNLVILGNIKLMAGKYQEAYTLYNKVIADEEKRKNKKGMIFPILNLGTTIRDASEKDLEALGINPANRYQLASDNYFRSLELSKEVNDILKQKECWNEISRLYELQGDYKNAYDSYKNFISLRDSIQGQEVKKNITRLEMQYTFDKKETELKYEQRLTNEKLEKQTLINIQQKQEIELTNKEKDLQRLAYLKEKAERQEKEKQLTLSEKEKQLQSAKVEVLGKEKALQASALKVQTQELKTREAQRNLFIGGTALMLLLAAAIFLGLQRTAKEKKVSESLLLNILPGEVAEELKAKGSAEARHFDEITVMFTDFKGFTQIAEKMSPGELVAEIDVCFKAFDAIITRNGLEKIKTIGDSYMCAGGLPVPTADHAAKVVIAALEIQEFMEQHQRERAGQGKARFEARIGIHTGPVVAGIVGVKKFAYDIWGDTVNIASRMESSGEAGKVNISGSTYDLVKDKFMCQHRGKIEAKNKGEIDMYFVGKS